MSSVGGGLTGRQQYGGYMTDITRTWPVGGKFTPAQRDLYTAVLNVQRRCVGLCRESADMSLNDIHQVSVDGLADELAQLGFSPSRDVPPFSFSFSLSPSFPPPPPAFLLPPSSSPSFSSPYPYPPHLLLLLLALPFPFPFPFPPYLLSSSLTHWRDQSLCKILYPHHVGHYIGVDLHDCATYGLVKKLHAGQVVTIEP